MEHRFEYVNMVINTTGSTIVVIIIIPPNGKNYTKHAVEIDQ